MEGKTPTVSVVMMGAILIGLFLTSTSVEAQSCCKDTTARNCYNVCRRLGGSRPVCSASCNCKIISGQTETTMKGASSTSNFCKLGCATSVCSNIIDLENSRGGHEELQACLDCQFDN
ncbi:hypothetical protein MKW94_020551 [Papaver nudicaule]|uniref:Acidic protein n=1 Tax=Papaver nudicaule TaxID=74823 RepID=A0AA41S2M9_PAPNU|nr:hypothetical protein [Papaver nudicaule]